MSDSSTSTMQHLVSSAWLADHLDDPGVRIIEVSSASDDTAYRDGHIPGAVWWYWKENLWHPTDREFATSEEMARRLGSIGVSPQSTIVLYGRPVQFGTYAFWALTMCGRRDVRMLDGSWTRWEAEGRPVAQQAPTPEAVAYPVMTREESSRVGRDDVRARLGQPGRLLLDVRSEEEYRGERVSPPPNFDHGAERTGRIPGAVHLYYRELLNEDDSFKQPEELRDLFARVGAVPETAGEVVTYCRLSHRASLAWFAMRYLLGFASVRVYDGSWTEWGSIVGFPVEK